MPLAHSRLEHRIYQPRRNSKIIVPRRARKGAKSPFADFIRNAKSEEKKRVYNTVLTEATKRQNEVLVAAQAART